MPVPVSQQGEGQTPLSPKAGRVKRIYFIGTTVVVCAIALTVILFGALSNDSGNTPGAQYTMSETLTAPAELPPASPEEQLKQFYTIPGAAEFFARYPQRLSEDNLNIVNHLHSILASGCEKHSDIWGQWLMGAVDVRSSFYKDDVSPFKKPPDYCSYGYFNGIASGYGYGEGSPRQFLLDPGSLEIPASMYTFIFVPDAPGSETGLWLLTDPELAM